jgi:ketosteroid isomerase-like protein
VDDRVLGYQGSPRDTLIPVDVPSAGMNVERRNELIDAYFDALDENDYSLVEPYLSADLVYRSVGLDALHGPDGLRRYFEELRPFAGTVHEVENRMHSENGSAAEGRVTGEHEGESLDTGFCDVFEFDEDEEHLTRIVVYTNA